MDKSSVEIKPVEKMKARHLGTSGQTTHAWRQWLLLIAFVLLGMVVSWGRGQDNNFDLLNYHYYNAWAFVYDRANLDYFAAGIQSYFNPILDLPYYWLASGTLREHPAVLAALAGLPYGVILFFTFLLARQVAEKLPLDSGWQRLVFIFAAMGLAGTGSATWSQVGTTTNELTTGILVLAAVVVFIGEADKDLLFNFKIKRLLVSGLLLGLAAGLKLTAAVYIPAMALTIVAITSDWRTRVRDTLVFGFVSGVAFMLSYGFWGWHLFQQFGNPFFPMFNSLFHSEWMAAVDGRDVRFIPKDAWQWVFYPFYWLGRNESMVAELPFRDARLALFYTVLLAIVGHFLLSIIRGRQPSIRFDRTIVALIIFAISAYCIWLILFSILRYAVVIEILASILTLALVFCVVSLIAKRNAVGVSLIVIVLLTTGAVSFATLPDWGHVRFSQKILDLDVPRLGEDSLVVFADQPMGFLAPLLAARQPRLRFIGLPSYLIKGSPFYHFRLGREVAAALDAHRSRLYVAYYANSMPSFPGLAAFGVVIDENECQIVNSNVSSDIRVCRGELRAQYEVSRPYRLHAVVSTESPHTTLYVEWVQNRCLTLPEPGIARFLWNSFGRERHTLLFVRSPPAAKTLFAAGADSSTAQTGPWVQAGQVFTLVGNDGREMATASIVYVPCR